MILCTLWKTQFNSSSSYRIDQVVVDDSSWCMSWRTRYMKIFIQMYKFFLYTYSNVANIGVRFGLNILWMIFDIEIPTFCISQAQYFAFLLHKFMMKAVLLPLLYGSPLVALNLHAIRGGGHLYFRLDIIFVKWLTKHSLNMYLSVMKIDSKYAFLHRFLNFSIMSLICHYDQKRTLLPILPFCSPKWYTRVHIAWSWKTTLITLLFLRWWYPPRRKKHGWTMVEPCF